MQFLIRIDVYYVSMIDGDMFTVGRLCIKRTLIHICSIRAYIKNFEIFHNLKI